MRKLQFYGYHGVMPEENTLGQRYIVNTTLFLDLKKASISDNIKDTVNYAEVHREIKDVVEGESFRLIEKLADEIVKVIFEKFSTVQEVELEVIKPNAPFEGHYKNVSVVIHRKR